MSINIVQHRSVLGVGVSSISLAFLSPNAAGNLLIYAIGENGSQPTLTTDSNGNTVDNVFSGGIASGKCRLDFVKLCNAGSNTVTAHGGGSDRIHLHIWEISGCISDPLDQSNTKSQTATNVSISTTSPTVVAEELVFGYFYDFPSNDTLTIGSGFNASEFTAGVAATESMLTEVNIVGTVGIQTASIVNAVQTISMIIATFKVAPTETIQKTLQYRYDG